MGREFQIEVIHRETITPSSPTPPHLKSLTLSIFDQIAPEFSVPLVLFYPCHSNTANEDDINQDSSFAEISGILKASLSKTLTLFYPFAGKFQYNDSITCDDRGAAFIEARVKCTISKILENPDLDMLEQLHPPAFDSKEAYTCHLLQVQVNFFECGGFAIGLSISHKVADGFTYGTFLRSWSAVALNSKSTTDHQVLPLEFGTLASLFPPQDISTFPNPVLEGVQEKCVTRRFVFDASSIAALKSKAASAAVPNPTRVQAVMALIWKCAREASRSTLGSTRPAAWIQAMNMRKRSGPTENLLGNFVWTTTITAESEVDLQSLVAKLRKGMEDYQVNHPNGITAEHVCQSRKDSGNILATKGMDTYVCTSVCRYPFYEVNFGWGKPSWVTMSSSGMKNSVFLIDANDGTGIEGNVTLLDENMAIVERNQELLAYASLNPSVITGHIRTFSRF